MKYTKTIILSLILSIFIITSVAAQDKPPVVAAQDKPPFEKLMAMLPPQHQVKTYSMLETLGIYEIVTKNNEIFYLTTDGRYAIIGNVIEVATNRNLTAEKLEQINRTSWDDLPLADAIVEKKGDGSDKIAVFGDPYCPHCKELDKQLEYLDNITIYRFTFPLNEESRKTALTMCAQAKPDVDCQQVMARTMVAAERIKVDSTPTIIFADGAVIKGYIPVYAIAEKLKTVKEAKQNITKAKGNRELN